MSAAISVPAAASPGLALTWNRVLEIEPRLAWAWARKGRTMRLLMRYDEALTCYDRAIDLNPHFAWAWTGKGQVLERLNQIERALAELDTRWN